jgi:hypothetical protein
MFDSAELKSLAQQQETLVAESDLRRRLVIAEATALREELTVGRLMAQRTAVPSLLLALGTAAGMFAWRKSASRFRWLPWLLSAWKIGRRWLRW